MGACAAPMPPRKRRAFNPKLCPCARRNACVYFVGLLAPRPRQHGMLHPKLRLTTQEKAIEKENAATLFQAQHLFSSSKLYRHCAKRTMRVALPLPGRGGGISPHIQKTSVSFSKRNRLCFIKQSLLGFMPVRASFGIKRPAFTWGCGSDVSPRRWRYFL